MSEIVEYFPSEKDLIKQIMNISATVWKHELTGKDIENWLSNFTGEIFTVEEEKLIALWLLTHFVYYNEDEVRYLCKILYKDFVHYLICENSILESDVKEYIKSVITNYQFYYLGKASESGSFILYFFRQVNNLALVNFSKHLNIEEEIPGNIVFIDDVTLTADETSQAYMYFDKLKVKDNKKILLTLIASEEAIKNLEKIGVIVIAAIILEKRNRCFDSASDIFQHNNHLMDACQKMCTHYGTKIKPGMPLGYKNGQYTFGFFYNTPDNTLPVFWADDSWNPIVKRYDKNYKSKFFEYERFV